MTEAKSKEFRWVARVPGGRRRILDERRDAITVEFAFERGAGGTLYHSVQLQKTYVGPGVFDFSIGEETVRCSRNPPSDSILTELGY